MQQGKRDTGAGMQMFSATFNVLQIALVFIFIIKRTSLFVDIDSIMTWINYIFSCKTKGCLHIAK